MVSQGVSSAEELHDNTQIDFGLSKAHLSFPNIEEPNGTLAQLYQSLNSKIRARRRWLPP